MLFALHTAAAMRRTVACAAAILVSMLLSLPDFAADVLSTVFSDMGEVVAIARDADGVVYVASRGRIHRIDLDGRRDVVAGNGTRGYSGDGSAYDAQLGRITGMAVKSSGFSTVVYFTEFDHDRIRKLDHGNLSTIAGAYLRRTYSGDGGPAYSAGIPGPTDIVFDGEGRMFVTSGNRIRVIGTDNMIHTFAGGSEAGDSDGGNVYENVRFNAPAGLAVSADGKLLVADSGNNRIRTLALQGGAVGVLAGNGQDGYAGQTGPATALPLGAVNGLHADGGVVYATLPGAHRIVRIAAGVLSPYAGDGIAGDAADGVEPISGRLSAPADVGPGVGGIYIADTGNSTLRRVGPPALVPRRPSAPIVEPMDTRVRVTLAPNNDPEGLQNLGFEVRSNPATTVEVRSPDQEQEPVYFIAENGTPYRYSVRYRYQNGVYGEWSPESDAVVPAAPVMGQVEDVTVDEGDTGETPLVLRVTVPGGAPISQLFSLHTYEGTANSPTDFKALSAAPVAFAAGQTTVDVTVMVRGDAVAENDETIIVVLEFRGNEIDRAVATIRNDDDGTAEPVDWGVEDRFELLENSAEVALDVLANDHFADGLDSFEGGSITITHPPVHGSARIVHGGNPAYIEDDQLMYTPATNWTGEDALAYRVCDVAGACQETLVTVRVRFSGWANVFTNGQSGRAVVSVANPRPLTRARFAATQMRSVPRETLTVSGDERRNSPWDGDAGGTQLRWYTLPASAEGTSADWQVVASMSRFMPLRMHLYVGVDDNNDGLATADETRCMIATVEFDALCDFPLTHPGSGRVRYWVMLHNATWSEEKADLAVLAVPMTAGPSQIVATGPQTVAGGQTLAYTASYNDPTILESDFAIGFVRVLSGAAGEEVDRVPAIVRVDGFPSTNSGSALANGVPQVLRLEPGGAQDRMFIDVPAGASALTVVTDSEANVDLYLAPQSTPNPSVSTILAAPARSAAVLSAIGASGDETLTISGSQLTPGRWYVTPVNPGSEAVALEVTATIATAATPVVRPGSYFNASRAGHGVFLYPAGDQWVAIWYTFLTGGRTTWYYAQGPQPGADGIWRGTLYHSSWSGNDNLLTPAGEMKITPTGTDRFLMTTTLHGLTSSEPMASLGRGCPTFSGMPVDISANWFNPATAGSGYSVQVWPNYEFYAAFVYDNQGEARYLVAERNGGTYQADATIALEQMHGFSPWQAWPGSPTRFPVGSLRRVMSGNTLSRIVVSATFTDGVPGSWAGDDDVQILGGLGATQGCDP